MSAVTLIDYKIGNLLSVERAIEHLDVKLIKAETAHDILKADKVILPGVGAFQSCVDALKDYDFYDAVAEYLTTDKPLLGICVGMQMLFDASEEFGTHKGFSAIEGTVKAIPKTKIDGSPHKTPHIGWTDLDIKKPNNPMLENTPNDANVYFVHSFTAHPDNDNHRVADAYYGGQQISAMVNKGNIYGTQFHPEKSGPIGLNILKNFLML